MRIYLDTKDLVNVLESSEPMPPNELAGVLSQAKSQLVISFPCIAEIAAPLQHRGAKTNVMAVLGKLENFPLAFIADARIQCMELEEAVKAFRSGREYLPIDPYVPRFDQVVPTKGEAPTSPLISYSLSATVWDLWTHEPKLFDGYARHRIGYEESMGKDRRMTAPPSLRKHFPATVKKDLDLYAIDYEGVDIQAFGNWIYSSPQRCPAKRLAFEVWHRLRSNRTDQLLGSDLTDFNHLFSLPYVDAFTADRRIRGYLGQVLTSVSLAPSVKVLPSATEVVDHLLSTPEGYRPPLAWFKRPPPRLR